VSISFPRGNTCLEEALDVIDRIVATVDGLYWWVTDVGLKIGRYPQEQLPQIEFNLFAGKVYSEWLGAHTRLHSEALTAIAKAIDAQGYSLKEHLPAEGWEQIADWNRRHAKKAVKAFEDAVSSKFKRIVLKKLYRAHDRYRRLNPSS
jgi:hypothetical protein